MYSTTHRRLDGIEATWHTGVAVHAGRRPSMLRGVALHAIQVLLLAYWHHVSSHAVQVLLLASRNLIQESRSQGQVLQQRDRCSHRGRGDRCRQVQS